MKNKPLTFENVIKLLEHGEKSIHCKLALRGCYSAKDFFYESETEVDVFNYIDETRYILNKEEFEKYYGNALFFDSFN